MTRNEAKRNSKNFLKIYNDHEARLKKNIERLVKNVFNHNIPEEATQGGFDIDLVAKVNDII